MEAYFIRCLIQKTATITFVLLNFVWIAWDAITADIPDDDWVKAFDEYFENTWTKSQFTPRCWII